MNILISTNAREVKPKQTPNTVPQSGPLSGGGGGGQPSMYVPILIFKLGHFAFLGVGHVPVGI